MKTIKPPKWKRELEVLCDNSTCQAELLCELGDITLDSVYNERLDRYLPSYSFTCPHCNKDTFLSDEKVLEMESL